MLLPASPVLRRALLSLPLPLTGRRPPIYPTNSMQVYALTADDPVEVGPFKGTGLHLRSSGIMAIYR